MMVIFTSRSEKKATGTVRKILDSFAERIGNDTWKTIITEKAPDFSGAVNPPNKLLSHVYVFLSNGRRLSDKGTRCSYTWRNAEITV